MRKTGEYKKQMPLRGMLGMHLFNDSMVNKAQRVLMSSQSLLQSVWSSWSYLGHKFSILT